MSIYVSCWYCFTFGVGEETHFIFNYYRNVSCWKLVLVGKYLQVSGWTSHYGFFHGWTRMTLVIARTFFSVLTFLYCLKRILLFLLLLFSDCYLFFLLHVSGSLEMIYDNSHVNALKLVDLPAADAIFPLVL